MESLKPVKLRLSDKLADPNYFSKFFDERTRDEVATQLRELRELRGLSQVKFAAESGMHQSAVSRIEQSEYSGWTYKTLLRAAMTLKARLKIELIPAEKVIEGYRKVEAERETASKLSACMFQYSQGIALSSFDPPELPPGSESVGLNYAVASGTGTLDRIVADRNDILETSRG